MTLTQRQRDLDEAVRETFHHLKRIGISAYPAVAQMRSAAAARSLYDFETKGIRAAFARIQSTRAAASALSQAGHIKRRAKTARLHAALRAEVGRTG